MERLIKEMEGHSDDSVTLRDIKHWMQNMSANMLTIAKTGEGNRERLEGIERTLDKSGYDKRLLTVEAWITEMARHGTLDNYKGLYTEAEKSKEFRTKTLAIWGVVVGGLTLMNLILTAVALAKLFVSK